MLTISLLGTGGMMPLPYRHLTAMLARYNGNSILIDCGEGTQIALKKAGFSPNPISVMCLTHFHADHVSGLPGMLLAMGNADRTEPLTIIGPRGLERVVNALRVIAPELPFDLNLLELEDDVITMYFGDLSITAFKVNHKITCYGYTLSVERRGRFDPERARALNIPLRYWNRLQKGETIEDSGITYVPSMVMGQARKGLKAVYVTDTRPTDEIVHQATGADLFICEGMYGEEGMEKKARQNRHMTFYEAARMGSQAKPDRMWLTHFSPSLNHPEQYKDAVRAIYPPIHIPKDGETIELMFEEP